MEKIENNVATQKEIKVSKLEIEILSGFQECVQNNPSCGSSCSRQKNA